MSSHHLAPVSNFVKLSEIVNGNNSYKKTFNLNTTDISYGSGDYEIVYSTRFITTTTGEFIFNYETAEGDGWQSSGSYSTSTGSYIGNRYLAETTYRGEFFYIKLPEAISLVKYEIGINFSSYPVDYKIYGSMNGTTWDIVYYENPALLVILDNVNPYKENKYGKIGRAHV